MNANQNKNVNRVQNLGGKMSPEGIPDFLKDIEVLIRKILDGVKNHKDVMPEDIRGEDITIDSLSNSYLPSFRSRNRSIIVLARPGVIEEYFQNRLPIKYTCDDAILIEYDPVSKDIPKMVIARCDKQVLDIIDENSGIIGLSGF